MPTGMDLEDVTPPTMWNRLRKNAVPVSLVSGIIVVAVVFVLSTLTRPAVATFSPTPLAIENDDSVLVGPRVYTIDATYPDRWQFFDFSRGSVVIAPGPTEWDMAFRRFQVIVNGGDGFLGNGGVLDLGPISFDSLASVPLGGYMRTTARTDSTTEELKDWYSYSWTSHILQASPHVFAIRTADGRYAKLEFVGYYCPGALPGCMTFRYVYQGGGGPKLGGPPVAADAADVGNPDGHRPDEGGVEGRGPGVGKPDLGGLAGSE